MTYTVKHGNWEFDFGKYNVYNTNIESCDLQRFVHSNTELTFKDNQLSENDINDFRKAANIHKIARSKALSMLVDGVKLADVVDTVESTILQLCRQDPNTYYSHGSCKDNNSGIAFPVGVNINNIVAHDSKLPHKDNRILFNGDVVKIDIGVHVNGRIIDSAFTHIITTQPGVTDSDNIYNAVIDASRDSTFSAIKMLGPDQRIIEISETIDEIIRSYEVDVGGNVLDVRPVKGIGGHNIKQYHIHGGKLVLCEPDSNIQGESYIEEDEIYAIETYATTGAGVMTQNSEGLYECTHFMKTRESELNKKGSTKKEIKYFKKTDLDKWLDTRNYLPFSSDWLFRSKIPRSDKDLHYGASTGQIEVYPPLYDEANAIVAQFEHTVHVKSSSIEIFSLGKDY